MENKYLGANQIVGVEKEDYKSINGKDVVSVLFVNGQKQTITQEVLDILVKDEAIDYTSLYEERRDLAENAMLGILMDYGFTFSEIKLFLEHVNSRMTDIFDKAGHMLWTGNSQSWTPGTNQLLFRTLLDAEKVLKDISPAEKEEEQQDGGK